jgi:glycosyltransferase involved in cell wall biosynthesis
MVHHMPSGAGDTGLPRLLREKLGARVRHATVSRATAQQLPWPIDAILPNPYDHELFRTGLDIPRTKDIVFLGRLIPEKGLHVLIESLGILRRQGSSLSATVVGAGPESARLAELAVTGGVPAGLQVVGELTGAPLARLLNQHRVMVVPSIGDEAFGVVALEGIACGCVVVASHAGGLPEAVGPCGMTFLRGDAAGLAATLKIILSSEDTLGGFRSKAAQHLAKHLPDFVALQYLSAAFAKVRNPLERQFAIGLGS